MGPQIVVSVHEPVEIPKPLKIGFGVCSFRSLRLLKQEALFWGFEWDKRSDNPEKNNNARCGSEPYYFVRHVNTSKMSASRYEIIEGTKVSSSKKYILACKNI